ncbi:unnamed protein product [Paramecium sonneborni]|uniref:Uncharacterized protein n=1 Tax=Paramecium sonneborni TaxID=65129 RepID=A0A8S1RP02_9CILI|nr:unnamed protein product [Paramecium sonneborni]
MIKKYETLDYEYTSKHLIRSFMLCFSKYSLQDFFHVLRSLKFQSEHFIDLGKIINSVNEQSNDEEKNQMYWEQKGKYNEFPQKFIKYSGKGNTNQFQYKEQFMKKEEFYQNQKRFSLIIQKQQYKRKRKEINSLDVDKCFGQQRKNGKSKNQKIW